MTILSMPREQIRVVLFEGIHQNAVDQLKAAGYTNVTLLPKSFSGDELLQHVADAHIIGVRSRTQITQEVLNNAPKLMAVGCFCIGTNQVDLPAAAALGVPVFNAPHSNTRSVAELVLAETVMLFRGLGDKNTAMHQSRWTKSAAGSHEIRGKTLGIVGYGHIGSQVSILAEAFGMRVLYYDIEPKLAMGNAQAVSTLEGLLAQVDIVTLHVPAAPDTVNLIGHKELKALKRGAYVINAARGNVVEIDSLAAALRDGQCGGAAIDVFPKEPKSNQDPFESELLNIPNVIMTPHIGGSTQEAQENIGIEVASKLVAYSDVGTTLGSVNLPNISLASNQKAHRLLHIHENRPGVMGAINRALADAEANILGQHLQTMNEIGYVVTDVDQKHSEDIQEKLTAVPGTIRCRILY